MINSHFEFDMPVTPTLFLEFHGGEAEVAAQAETVREIAQEHGLPGYEAAADETERRRLWHARHGAYEATKATQPGCEVLTTDVCVPVSELAASVLEAQADIAEHGLKAAIVGHVGDGNFHVAIVLDPDRPGGARGRGGVPRPRRAARARTRRDVHGRARRRLRQVALPRRGARRGGGRTHARDQGRARPARPLQPRQGRAGRVGPMSAAVGRRLTGMLTEGDLAALSERHRRELHVHCYRMLASFEEAEDAVQETLLRAWRARATFAGGPNARAWLYRIATNTCLDALKRRGRRPQTVESFGEVPWIQPYADSLLDDTVERETIELAFLAVIQLLPPRQRAVVIARDVMGWSAVETSELLDTSVAAVNSALQRAHVTLRRGWDRRGEAVPEEAERALVRAWIDAHEREDVAGMVALMREDIRVTMPPHPALYVGVDALAPLFDRAFGSRRLGAWRLLALRVNRQPATAGYLRRPGDTAFRAFKLDVMRVEGDRFAEMTTFDPGLFGAFGLPAVL